MQSALRVELELFADQHVSALIQALMFDGFCDEVRGPMKAQDESLAEHVQSFCAGTLQGGQLHWAIRNSATGACIGAISATLSITQRLELGYRVEPGYRGRGVATAAVRQVVDQLEGWLQGVEVFAIAENANSARVLVKAGFSPMDEAEREKHSEYDGKKVYKFQSRPVEKLQAA